MIRGVYNAENCVKYMNSCDLWDPSLLEAGRSVRMPCDKGAMGFFRCLITGLEKSSSMLTGPDPPLIQDFITHTQTAAKNWLIKFDRDFGNFSRRVTGKFNRKQKG